MRLVPDIDEVPALSIEREALWKRVGEASFLTDDEKRAAAGYEPLPAHSLTTLLAHREYNEAIRALSDDFLSRNGLTGREYEMTSDHARNLLKEIRESRDVRIWNYNRMILMRELR